MWRKNKIQGIRAFLALFFAVMLLLGSTLVYGATEEKVRLEKTASWVDAESYQAEIHLKVTGIENYTRNQKPIQVVPVLDMTNSMNCCESENHVRPLRMHAISAIPGYKELWEKIRPLLPSKEEYTSYGQESPENLFLNLPDEIDPTHRARLFCCQRDGTDTYSQEVLGGWKVIYVTDNQTPLWDVEEADYAYLYHSVPREGEGIYMPVGTMEVKEKRTVWKARDTKWEDYGCSASRMDDLIAGYTRFIEEVFKNENAKVCPVAFVGGYYTDGWMDNKEDALAFLNEGKYKDATLVSPDENTGTNLEAAVAGAEDAVLRAQTTENTFVLIFTDGAATSGYVHNSDGTIDMGKLDSHSYHQEEWDTSWYPAFGEWAVEDAAYLKEKVPVYTVGYGYNMKYDDFSQETLRRLSSGEKYFIDTREEELSQIMAIFQNVYTDMIQKATQVQIVDYISEYWSVDPEKLPYGWQVEDVDIKNQAGRTDTIQKISFPVTKEMGTDDREEFVIPITLRQEYRDVKEKTAYETNQDIPFDKPEEGSGAKVRYLDLEGKEAMTEAPSPKLEVYPKNMDFVVEKKADRESARAGDTVNYEISISNTGECVLHSVITVDQFVNAGVQAVFAEQSGVEISENGTKALIGAILPGTTFVLKASAQIPEGFSDEKLVNVAIVSVEDGKEGISQEGKAEIEIKEEPTGTPTPTDTPTPTAVPTKEPADTPKLTPEITESPVPSATPQMTLTPTKKLSPDTTYSPYKGTVKGTVSGASNPKTGDTSPILLWLIIGGTGGILGAAILFWNRGKKEKGKVEKRK